jgi:hypothetical protein
MAPAFQHWRANAALWMLAPPKVRGAAHVTHILVHDIAGLFVLHVRCDAIARLGQGRV